MEAGTSAPDTSVSFPTNNIYDMSVNEIKIKRASTAFELRGTGPLTSRTIVLGDEDHTLGNALRHVLMNDARVDFAGYCVPHPSEPIVHLRIQSNTNTTEQQPLTAIEALKEACTTLASQCDIVLEKLMDAAPEVKEDCERMERIREEEEQRMNEEEDEDDGEDEDGGEEMYDDE